MAIVVMGASTGVLGAFLPAVEAKASVEAVVEAPGAEDGAGQEQAPVLQETAPVPTGGGRRRARVKGGRFRGDDPTTKPNEAWEN